MCKYSSNSVGWARAIAALGGVALSVIALSPPDAAAKPGELAATFADRGVYLRPDAGGAWAIGLRDDALFLGGGAFRRGFVDRLQSDGLPAAGFLPYSGAVVVLDLAVQPDGKVVAVGQQIYNSDLSTRPYFVRKILRLEANGEIDLGFNPPESPPQPYLASTGNYSVVLATDGRIVVAGTTGGTLVIERHLPDGSLDPSFATDGKYTGEGLGGRRPIVVSVPGGYHVPVQDRAGGNCRVLALAADGSVDAAYGEQGFASLGGVAGEAPTCSGIAALADGRVQVVGTTADKRAFAVRLTPDGHIDTEFDATAILGALGRADAVAVAPDGASIIAGASAGGEAGIRVLRLLPGGSIDHAFGDAGTAWVDVTSASLRDLALLPGSSMVLAGSFLTAERTAGAFAVRLLGDVGAGGPGALGFKWSRIDVTQQDRTAELTIRRTGGAAGPVSIGYRTKELGQPPLTDVTNPATPGDDFDVVTGTLTWADGDASERVIQVPLGADGPAVEDFEAFEVELRDATGAIVGTRTATVTIAADGSPAGFLAIEGQALNVSESEGAVSVGITRRYYSAGALSVKLVPSPGTARAGSDFAAAPVTVTWGDGETGTKYAAVGVMNDSERESMESFTVELADATGGAAIGPESRATVNIHDDDSSPSPPPGTGGSGSGNGGGSGGGGFDGFVLALLGLAFAVRARCVRLRT